MSTPSKQPPPAATVVGPNPSTTSSSSSSSHPQAPLRRPSMNPPKTSTHTRSPSRPTVQQTTSSSTATPSRTKSVRTTAGAPPSSARAAAKKPTSTTTTTPTTTTTLISNTNKSTMADAKAENVAAIDDLRERLQKAETLTVETMKQNAILQARLDEAHNDHNAVEESVHEHQERLEELQNEKKESIRQRREFEAIYEAERAQTMKEKEESQAREDELYDTIKRLKEAMAQKDLRGEDERRPSTSRTSSFRSNASPHTEPGQFAPPSSLQRSDSSRSSSRLVLQKDKIIESLRLELAEAQIKLVEVENMGGGRMQELEKSLMEARVANARLVEDNESFQLLLSEKTLNGDFAHSGLLRAASSYNDSRPSSPSVMVGASTLADELENASDDGTTDNRRLQADLSSLRAENKALTLYINNIISRLLMHKEFENILDKTPDLMSGAINKQLPPPPPIEKDEQLSLLQRATSAVRGGKPRPRPHQTHSEPQPQPTMNEDPNTAPRIPLTRKQSNRRSTSDFGSDEATRRQSMPPPALPTSTVPKDSARNSVYSEPGIDFNAASPPRSTASSSERPSGAIMRGAGMRPLRLVQEAKEEEDAARKAKRTSWMGWFGAAANNGTASASVGGNGL